MFMSSHSMYHTTIQNKTHQPGTGIDIDIDYVCYQLKKNKNDHPACRWRKSNIVKSKRTSLLQTDLKSGANPLPPKVQSLQAGGYT